jgi:hypothetical protein
MPCRVAGMVEEDGGILAGIRTEGATHLLEV